jgi:hypothetical protein
VRVPILSAVQSDSSSVASFELGPRSNVKLSRPHRGLVINHRLCSACPAQLVRLGSPKMDQAQTRALSALQPFIHLALTTSSPTPRFLADLITRATSAPGTYIFTELLQTPAIQSLRSPDTPPEFQAYLTVLEIFSYGTYEEYTSMTLSLVLAPTNCTNPYDSHT